VKKILAIIVVLLITVSAVLYVVHLDRADSNILVVPDDYVTIEWAVGNATAGDTVYVKSGTYNERGFVIDKPLSFIGEDCSNTILIGGYAGITGGGSTVVIKADNVTVSGFTIRSYDFDTPAWYFFGICVDANNCNITGNIIENCDCGIWNGGSLSTVSSVTISNNTIQNNLHAGIEFEGTAYNITITDNIIESNLVGITLSRYGFNGSENEERFVVSGNDVINNGEGVYLDSSSSLIIRNNVTSNTDAGIYVVSGSNNTVSGNYVADNGVGVTFSGSTASGNKFYNNSFVDNVQNLQITSTNYIEVWDNGTIGNYWSNYNGTDGNGDGIGDNPYIMNDENQDPYPLMEPIHIEAIPEFPSWTILPLLLTVALVIAVYRKRLIKSSIHQSC
jgi:nitrous oxidase accessory protein